MTDEEIISRCYEHGQPDYILAADAIKRLISERDEARMMADNKVGWRRWLPMEEALHIGKPYFANETGGHFVGEGTPTTCLARIRRILRVN